jgi:hypothetical protein
MASKALWILLMQVGSKKEVALDIDYLPSLGHGKIIDGVGFEVVFVGTKLVEANDVILAVEHK